MAEKQPETNKKPTPTPRIVTIDGPIRVSGSYAYDAAGNRVTQVGID